MAKDYNGAHVWGNIHSIETKATEPAKKPYLELQVNCPSAKYGNIRAFCRVWGEKRVEQVMAAFSAGDTVKAQGMMSQYVGRHEVVKTNFNIFTVLPWDPDNDKHSDARATFILSGECEAFADGNITIRIVRTNEDETKVLSEESFVIEFPAHMVIDLGGEPVVGMEYNVKGCLQQEEDEWGDLTVAARPVVMSIREVASGNL